MDEQNNQWLETLVKLLDEVEGYEPNVYKDFKGIDTVGIGGNLRSPATQQSLEELGIDQEELKQGQRSLSKEEADELLKRTIFDKEKYLQNIHKDYFPNFQMTDNQKAALLSLGINSPKLWGPNLREALNQNDLDKATREILLNSNKEQSGGLAKRRLKEAELFSGKDFNRIINTLNPEELGKLRNQINTIENINEKENVLNTYPFLKENNNNLQPLEFNRLKRMMGNNNNG